MKQYILRLIDSASVHLYRLKYFYLTALVVVSAIAGVIYHIDTGKDYDTYQVCPKYHGTQCELLPVSDWDVEVRMSTIRFFSKTDPARIKVYQYSTLRKIKSNNY